MVRCSSWTLLDKQLQTQIDQVSKVHINQGLALIWRKRWDSNPRRTHILGSFQDCCIQPLCHASRCDSLTAGFARPAGQRGERLQGLNIESQTGWSIPFVSIKATTSTSPPLCLEIGHNKGLEALGCRAHPNGVGFHHRQISTHIGRQIGLVDDEQIAFRDTGATFARDFFIGCYVDHVDREVAQFGAEGGGQRDALPNRRDSGVHPLVRGVSAELSPSGRNDCQEGGVFVDPSSINRWAIRFLPWLEKVFRKHKRPVGG